MGDACLGRFPPYFRFLINKSWKLDLIRVASPQVGVKDTPVQTD